MTDPAPFRRHPVEAGGDGGLLPDGPAELWFAVFADDGELMGTQRITTPPAWLWRDGQLGCSYAPVTIRVTRRGWYKTGLLCAASPATGAWRPLTPIDLGPPAELRPGHTITIADGVIAIRFDPAGHG